MIKKWDNYINEELGGPFKIEPKGSKDLSTTKSDIEKRALELVEQNIDLIFNKLHQEFKTDAGDIYPEQGVELDNLQESLVKLMTTQVTQNIGIKNIRSNVIDVDILEDLDTEKDIKVGDDVIMVFDDFRGFSIYLGVITTPSSAINDTRGIGFEIVSNGKTGWGGLKDAYLAVKVDTYNDWCDPSKRIPD